jgi:hypothetical protein
LPLRHRQAPQIRQMCQEIPLHKITGGRGGESAWPPSGFPLRNHLLEMSMEGQGLLHLPCSRQSSFRQLAQTRLPKDLGGKRRPSKKEGVENMASEETL